MEYHSQILIHRFLRSAVTYPGRPALAFSDRQYSYQELLNRAFAYASLIAARDERSPVIGLMAHRTFETYAGILGILMAGKGYLPLNPNFPSDRNRFMLEKAGTRTILTGGGSAEDVMAIVSSSGHRYHLIDAMKVETTDRDDHAIRVIFKEALSTAFPALLKTGPGDVAYLLFTSGSTGQPKGVAVSNRNVTAYLDNITSLMKFEPEDRFSQTFDLTFDLSVHDLFVCWSVGGCLCVPDDNSTFGLSRYMKMLKPTVWFSVPSVPVLMERMRLLKDNAFPWTRLSLFCGEALLQETAMAWKNAAPSSVIANLYGPTEATIAISAYRMPEGPDPVKAHNGVVSIGKIFPEHHYLLKDEDHGRGMLCLAGPQVVSGYFKDTKLTEGHFLAEGASLLFYNTGDLVEVDEEGDLFFLGRADSEVKISGYRVNLLEIDHVMAAIPEVDQAATLYLEDPVGLKTLVSFVVMPGETHGMPYLLQHCRRKLPHYMVPEKIIFVEAMPLNPNGKIDRKALAAIFRKQYEQGN